MCYSFTKKRREGSYNPPLTKDLLNIQMIAQAKTIQEKRAVNFAVELLSKFGYGHTVCVPSRQLANELTCKGRNISFMTVIAYWETLERMGYVTREMGARINGVTYHLNRYRFSKLLE